MRRALASHAALSRIAIAVALFLAARTASADVLKIVVDGPIHPLVEERIGRAVQEAERSHAEALLIELRTPGGLVSSTRDIIHDILSSPVPVIIYVTPSGSNAASAGFYILESGDVAAMAPGTNTGAAHPVLGGGETMDPVMKEKLENDAAALMRSYSAKRGRNVEVAESAVRQSKSFSADEALNQHLIDYIAKDESDLLRQLDGKTITRFDGSKFTFHVAGMNVRLYPMTVKEEILSTLMDPNISVLLLIVGFVAVLLEFSHPGAIIPGVVGFIAILLAFYAIDLLPFRSIALVLILSAFALFILEAKFQTHGVAGLGGIVLMVLGALLLIDGPIPEMRVSIWTALGVSLPLGGITIFLMTIAFKARMRKVQTGEQGMVGEIGVVTASLAPAGKVFVQGEIWDAVSTQNIEAGRRVIIKRVENLVLQVEPLREPVLQPTAAS